MFNFEIPKSEGKIPKEENTENNLPFDAKEIYFKQRPENILYGDEDFIDRVDMPPLQDADTDHEDDFDY